MHFNRRYGAIVSLTAAISLLTVSCSQSKVSQCKKLVNVAEGAIAQAQTASNKTKGGKPEGMLKVADTMDKAAQAMGAIELTDEKLKPYQAGLIKMYRNTSKATRDFVGAYNKKDRWAAEASLKNLQKATAPEQELVTGLNTYCKPN